LAPRWLIDESYLHLDAGEVDLEWDDQLRADLDPR
jgi:hypothetical protein